MDRNALRELLPELRGDQVYIPKRASIDWGAVYERWRQGETQAHLARELGVSREWVCQRLRPYRSPRRR